MPPDPTFSFARIAAAIFEFLSGLVSSRTQVIDFDAAGLRVLSAKLQIDPGEFSQDQVYHHFDPIWRSKKTNATIYVGDHHCAENAKTLIVSNIRCIVNCTRQTLTHRGELPNYLIENEAAFKYFEFPIVDWRNLLKLKKFKNLLDFFMPLFKFVEEAISKGDNVLVHCLAGAHRAGTTGIALMMYFTGMTAVEATAAAKLCRNIIDPIDHLTECLMALEEELKNRRVLSRLANSSSMDDGTDVTDGRRIPGGPRGTRERGGGRGRGKLHGDGDRTRSMVCDDGDDSFDGDGESMQFWSVRHNREMGSLSSAASSLPVRGIPRSHSMSDFNRQSSSDKRSIRRGSTSGMRDNFSTSPDLDSDEKQKISMIAQLFGGGMRLSQLPASSGAGNLQRPGSANYSSSNGSNLRSSSSEKRRSQSREAAAMASRGVLHGMRGSISTDELSRNFPVEDSNFSEDSSSTSVSRFRQPVRRFSGSGTSIGRSGPINRAMGRSGPINRVVPVSFTPPPAIPTSSVDLKEFMDEK